MSMRHTRPLLVVLVVALLAVACDRGGDKPEASPTPAATPTAAATASATASPATPTPLPGSIEVASTVQLIDVRTGAVKTLHQDTKQQAYSASFEGDEVLVNAGQFLRFRLDGTPSSGTPTPRDLCRNVSGAAEVGGRSYSGVRCGSISPNGRQMAYTVQTGEVEVGTSGYRVPVHDMWALDLQTGATRRLQAGLIDCGGCDGRYAPRWSTSNRYVAYAELGGTKRRYLSDLSSGVTRQIGSGNEVYDAPEWAPTGDVLVYSNTANGTVARFEDLAAGTSRDLAVPWPVRFDASGTYLYSPAWGAGPKSTAPPTTTIVEAASGKTLATLAGDPPAELLYTRTMAVTRSSGGYLAVLQRGGECGGTAIYREGVQQPRCIAGGVLGQGTPDGTRVVVARETGNVGPVHGIVGSSLPMPRYDVVVVDVATGASQTVVTGAISFTPPLMLWNAAGTHLIVIWPNSSHGL